MPRGSWAQHPTLLNPTDALAALAYRIAEFTGDEQAFEDPARCTEELTAAQADFLLRAYFPWLMAALYSRSPQRKLQRGIEDLINMIQTPSMRSNPWSREVQPARASRRNPSADILEQIVKERDREWYESFHGVPPKQVRTISRAWLPGEMVLLGTGVDIGYKIRDAQSAKEHRQPYVHEFSKDVKVFRRAKPGEKPTRTWRGFPSTLRELGFNLGFSYADKTGDVHEVKGSDRKYLACTPSRKILVVVGPAGVEYLLTGGRMEVREWIYH